ncbi:MAG: hypothetical protein ACUVXD_11370 [Thermodesulfobacteriota bacterium]
MRIDKAILADMQKKVQSEMVERERRLLEYWKGELEKVYRKRHEGLASLQLEIKGLLDRMENRMRILRKGENT